MDFGIILNLLHGRNNLKKKTVIGSKITRRFSKVWKMAIFKHFAKALYSKAKLSRMDDFVDEIALTKI